MSAGKRSGKFHIVDPFPIIMKFPIYLLLLNDVLFNILTFLSSGARRVAIGRRSTGIPSTSASVANVTGKTGMARVAVAVDLSALYVYSGIVLIENAKTSYNTDYVYNCLTFQFFVFRKKSIIKKLTRIVRRRSYPILRIHYSLNNFHRPPLRYIQPTRRKRCIVKQSSVQEICKHNIDSAFHQGT